MSRAHPLRAIKHHADAALKLNPPQMIRHPQQRAERALWLSAIAAAVCTSR
ncbi:MAG: hypothetical protein ACRED0_02365 [Gammaproteobacteria bacterium]